MQVDLNKKSQAGLQAGQGVCTPTASLLIKPLQEVISMGAASDVLSRGLSAVHQANRHGCDQNRIAVALPGMHMGRNCMLPGFDLVLFGPEQVLGDLWKSEGIATLKRRGMVMDTNVAEAFFNGGAQGTAFVRDRACEKRTPGWIRRTAARAARNGRSFDASIAARGNDTTALNLPYGKSTLHVRDVPAVISDAPLLVSTYGFCTASTPAPLPVMTKAVRLAHERTTEQEMYA